MNIQNIEDIREKIADKVIPMVRTEAYRGWQLRVADQILALTYNGFTLRRLVETALTVKEGECLGVVKMNAELPSKTLSGDALDAIEVKGVFPHVATAITLALARQSQHIQQDMLNANFKQVTLMVYRTGQDLKVV